MSGREEKFELIKSSYYYLRRFHENIEDEVNCYRTGKYTIENNNMADIIDGMKQTLTAIILTQDCHSITSAEEDAGRLASCAEEITESLEGSDFLTIADILEYEMMPLADEWREQLAVALKNENKK